MKLIKSTIKRDKPIGELPHGKVTITMEGTDAEDALNNCLIELDRLKDPQSKAIVITYLLGTLPMDLQKFIAEQQQKIVVGIAVKNMVGEGPEAMLDMLLMGAILRGEDSDE